MRETEYFDERLHFLGPNSYFVGIISAVMFVLFYINRHEWSRQPGTVFYSLILAAFAAGFLLSMLKLMFKIIQMNNMKAWHKFMLENGKRTRGKVVNVDTQIYDSEVSSHNVMIPDVAFYFVISYISPTDQKLRTFTTPRIGFLPIKNFEFGDYVCDVYEVQQKPDQFQDNVKEMPENIRHIYEKEHPIQALINAKNRKWFGYMMAENFQLVKNGE